MGRYVDVSLFFCLEREKREWRGRGLREERMLVPFFIHPTHLIQY